MIKKTKNFAQLVLENAEREERINKQKTVSYNENYTSELDSYNTLVNMKESANAKMRGYNKFVQDTKTTLLAECLLAFTENASGYQHNKAQASIIQRNLVNQFINENGVDKLLNSMKDKTYVLSEMSRVIEKYTNIVLEKVDKDKPETYFIIPEDRDAFFKELDTDDNEEVASMIKIRVSDALDQFVQSNIKQKEELREILVQSKERIDAAKSEEVRESFNNLSKQAIVTLKEKKVKSVLEMMIAGMVKNTLKDKELSSVYMNEGTLDMDAIVENATTMYAFLETVNTIKIIDVDSKYIESVLNELK